MLSRRLSVPLDVIDTIIDIVKDDDLGWKTLRAFSLTSSVSLHQCRKHIFGTVKLMATGRPHPWDPACPTGDGVEVFGERFLRLLQRSPHIAQYVRVLVMRSTREVDGIAWMMKSEDVASIIVLLTRLETLDFRIVQPPIGLIFSGYRAWSQFEPPVQFALTSLIQSRRLQEFVLQGVGDLPISFLEQCAALNTLRLIEVTLEDTRYEDPDSEQLVQSINSSKNANIRSFSSLDSGSIVEWLFLSHAFDYAHFSFLDLELINDPSAFQLLFSFLEKATSLEDLHLSISYDVDLLLLEKLLNHRRLPHVQRISLFLDPIQLPHIYSFVKDFPENNQVDAVLILCPLADSIIVGRDEIAKWNMMNFDIPFKQLKFYFFFPVGNDAREEGSRSEDFTDELPEIITPGKFLSLIFEGKVQIFARDTPSYFGEGWELFHFEEARKIRDSIIGLT